ncbi:hypothetical protein [Prosthecobacter sp.]|uniref:hypothetical protein n=1 Tax=Prosthecobacter sp. TaxID=1965333 RepID=UPI003784172F
MPRNRTFHDVVADRAAALFSSGAQKEHDMLRSNDSSPRCAGRAPRLGLLYRIPLGDREELAGEEQARRKKAWATSATAKSMRAPSSWAPPPA